ncbi:MAG: UDP-N-acetylglucosamine--N-acetylmuramyl-(pentapeptide) pyrophosphoryl-undecaprenol N-acetylglucosamine transferase [Patescibacteria group bacterium]|jgi:UDP-N-acetylglucosamine--N-acetylmuramyl-(pentapeptide) pyrophosphoryl-undecaprenol N-acetylglucosamine transferase
MTKEKTILLVGGGTGGHIVPIFELYEKLKESDKSLTIKVVGGGTLIEGQFFGGNSDYIAIETGKLHRAFTFKIINEIRKYFVGRAQARKILSDLKPDLIFSKGGYVSLPVIYWAKKLKIPYFIHESDIEMGEANKYAAKGATKVFVGFKTENYKDLHSDKLIFAGQFIPTLLLKQEKTKSLFDNAKPTIFVTGGSQGAIAINDVVKSSVVSLAKSYNIIHQTGDFDFDKMTKFRESLDDETKESYIVRSFFPHESGADGIYSVYRASDLFVGRASITFPAEATAVGLPLILIPYPHASADHQLKNGQALEKEGACVMIEQKDLNADLLIRKINGLMADPEKCDRMVSKAKEYFGSNALLVITESILNEIEK